MQKSPIELFNVVVVVVGLVVLPRRRLFFFCVGCLSKKLDKNLFPSIMKSK